MTAAWRISATALALAAAVSCASTDSRHATTSAAATVASDTPATSGALFVRRDDDALLTLAASEPPAWLRYQALVLSPARATPLLLFFDGDGVGDDSCTSSGDKGEVGGAGGDQEEAAAAIATDDDDDDDDDDGGDDNDDDALLEPRECSSERSALLSAALGGVARAFAHAGLRVVHVPESLLPQMLRYHRVTARPSLLWLAPRSAKNFQRFPHAETNALDLTSPAKLLEVLQTQTQQQTQQQQRRRTPSTPAPSPASSSSSSTDVNTDVNTDSRSTSAASTPEQQQQQLAAVLNEVVRAWFVKSGLAPASSSRTGVVPPAAPRGASGESAALSVAEFVPVLGLLAFVGVVAHDKRELLLKTLRGRFVWFFWSLGVTYAAYSGVFHSLIHGMPLLYFGAHHGLLLFHPSGRRQFVLEGLLSGAWSFLVSLGAFSVAEVLPMERSRVTRGEVFAYALLVAGVSCALLHVTFMAKTPWLRS